MNPISIRSIRVIINVRDQQIGPFFILLDDFLFVHLQLLFFLLCRCFNRHFLQGAPCELDPLRKSLVYFEFVLIENSLIESILQGDSVLRHLLDILSMVSLLHHGLDPLHHL